MLAILNTVLPVFLVVGAGYLLVKARYFPDDGVDRLMGFTQGVAIPALLFMALCRLDLGASFDAALIFSFYSGAILCFILGYLVARRGFNRRPGESVAIGFGALFSNSVLLGLPIMERAFGTDSLAPNYALISIHAPICYFIGITAMEFARADGRSKAETARVTVRAMFRNTISMACAAGLLVNLSGLTIPAPVAAAGDMLARAGLPAALFALGGVLSRYRIRATLGEAFSIALISTLLHPSIAYLLTAHVFDLDQAYVRSATVMAAMAPGVNAYVFASMYDRAKGEVAATVIIATAISVFTAAGWLWVLGGATG